ncbi:hypothetical protein SO802_003754 [Lithocarpus litseifolius]|uniref:Uncharacterized protein n=1 Tax=Lithocarpus litseifolius TaxID=425828 RepID=A0AAW2E4X3_9ROSI
MAEPSGVRPRCPLVCGALRRRASHQGAEGAGARPKEDEEHEGAGAQQRQHLAKRCHQDR